MTTTAGATGRKAAPTLEGLRRERLEAQLEKLEVDIARRAPESPASEEAWLQAARRSLEKARSATAEGQEQAAWTHLHTTFRFLLEGAQPDELRDRAKALRHEAGRKLSTWRRDAIFEVLAADSQTAADKSAVILAQFLMDQYYENVYFKMAILGTRLRQLNHGLAILAVLVLLASGWLFRGELPFLSSTWLTGFLEGLGIMVLGAVGAALSNALTTIRGQQRIPEVIQGRYEQELRLLIGALSAIALVLIVRSGILPIEPPQGEETYVYAVAAGLSDQLLSRVIRRIEESVQK